MEIVVAIFGGAQALANAAQAWQAYRVRHPKGGHPTGRIADYTQCHEGHDMTEGRLTFYQTYKHLIKVEPTQSGNAIVRASARSRSRQTLQKMKSLPTSMMSRLRSIGSKDRTGNAPQDMRPTPSISVAQPKIGGELIMIGIEQQAPNTTPDDRIGLSTGRRPGHTTENMSKHWEHFDKASSKSKLPDTIAVVNWTTEEITMFVRNEDRNKYFRNYRVWKCNLGEFAKNYKENAVFSGVIIRSSLVGITDTFIMVEDDGECEFTSTNCWSLLLGPSGKVGNDSLFVEMRRAAVLGLIECRYAEPAKLNVDMIGNTDCQFVHVDSPDKNLQTTADCCFSVFSFGDSAGWAKSRVLVG